MNAKDVTLQSARSLPSPAGCPDISVVVCTRNREAEIKDCLDSVVANGPGEIIVVDGQSTDGTVEVARKFTDRIVSDGGGGLAAARQLGAERATGGYVAYVDSDIVLGDRCLAELREVLEAGDYAGVHARILSAPGGSYWARGVQARMDLLGEYDPGEKPSLGCMAVLIRRDLIIQHRFDPFFVGASEDEDFYFRLCKAGWRLYCTDRAVAYHRHRDTFMGSVKQRMWYGRGAVRLAVRGHRKARRGLLLHPLVGLGAVLLWRALSRRRFEVIPFILLQIPLQYLGEAMELVYLLRRRTSRRKLEA